MGAVLADGILENYTGPGLGWLGGFIFTVIAIATVLLLRNMNKRIKRLPADFDHVAESAPDVAPDEAPPPSGSDSP